MGIEPTSSAWEAEVLPLNYTRLKKVASITHSTHPTIMPVLKHEPLTKAVFVRTERISTLDVSLDPLFAFILSVC